MSLPMVLTTNISNEAIKVNMISVFQPLNSRLILVSTLVPKSLSWSTVGQQNLTGLNFNLSQQMTIYNEPYLTRIFYHYIPMNFVFSAFMGGL